MNASVRVLLKDVGPSCHTHPCGVQKHIYKLFHLRHWTCWRVNDFLHSCPVSWYLLNTLLEIVLGDTTNLLVIAHMEQ